MGYHDETLDSVVAKEVGYGPSNRFVEKIEERYQRLPWSFVAVCALERDDEPVFTPIVRGEILDEACLGNIRAPNRVEAGRLIAHDDCCHQPWPRHAQRQRGLSVAEPSLDVRYPRRPPR